MLHKPCIASCSRKQDTLTGRVWIERGPAQLFLEPNVVAVGAKASAYALESHQYIRLQVGAREWQGTAAK